MVTTACRVTTATPGYGYMYTTILTVQYPYVDPRYRRSSHRHPKLRWVLVVRFRILGLCRKDYGLVKVRNPT